MTLSVEHADECGTDKGTHQGFLKYYDQYLPNPWQTISLVELGVYKGGSILMWDNYFKNQYTEIYGVDIDLTEFDKADPQLSSRVRIIQGDQACDAIPRRICCSDPAIHKRTLGEPVGFDVVIDDASHFASKTIASFETWWPHVMRGGLYIVEDTHCSYDTDYYGAEAGPPNEDVRTLPGATRYTTMGFLKRLADDVNWNYHGYDRFRPIHDDIAFVHFYPGICFIGKK